MLTFWKSACLLLTLYRFTQPWLVKPSRSVYFLDTLHILPESFVIICCLHPADYAKGFGGKYGVEKDKQDASAMGWDHHEAVEKHASQKGEDQETLGSGDIVRWDDDEGTKYYREMA